MRKLLASIVLALIPLTASAADLTFPPKFAPCGTSIETPEFWNEKVFGIQGESVKLASVQVIAAGADSVRIQIGPRSFPPDVDMVLSDLTDAPPFDVTRTINLEIPGDIRVRLACVNGAFGGGAFFTVILHLN